MWARIYHLVGKRHTENWLSDPVLSGIVPKICRSVGARAHGFRLPGGSLSPAVCSSGTAEAGPSGGVARAEKALSDGGDDCAGTGLALPVCL